jgi:hypothetical protein
MMTNLAELSDRNVLESERKRLHDDAADLRWAAGWLADNGKPADTIAELLLGAEIAERRAVLIP